MKKDCSKTQPKKIRLCDIATRGSCTYELLRRFATGRPLQVDRVHVWWLKFKRNVGRVKQQFRDKKMQDMIDARDILTQLLADHDKQYIIGMDIAIMKSRVWRRCIDRVKRKVQMVLLQSQKQEQMDKIYCESGHEVCERVKVQVWRECNKCANGWNAGCCCGTVEVYHCPMCKSTRKPTNYFFTSIIPSKHHNMYTYHPHFPFLHRRLLNNITYHENARKRCARSMLQW